jgi:hypothetical protein
VLLSVGEGPVVASEARNILRGEPLGEEIIARAARAAGHCQSGEARGRRG